MPDPTIPSASRSPAELVARVREQHQACGPKCGTPNLVCHDCEQPWPCDAAVLCDLAESLVRERDRLRDRSESYDCGRCGARYGMDASLPNSVWEPISAAAGGAEILCLWCIDEIAAQIGVTGEAYLYYPGKAIRSALYQSDGPDQRWVELVQLWQTRTDEAQARVAALEGLIQPATDALARLMLMHTALTMQGNTDAALYLTVDYIAPLELALAATREAPTPGEGT